MKYFIVFLVGVVFVISFTRSPVLVKAEENIVEIDTKAKENVSINNKHLNCMAKAIYFESRNEPLVGQLAVGLVVKNRAESNIFPKDICSVVYEGPHDTKGMPVLNRCQFSWYCDGQPKKITDTTKWERALFLAKTILSGKIFDFTDGALFFHNTSVSPNWKLKKIGSIGNHIFYKKT